MNFRSLFTAAAFASMATAANAAFHVPYSGTGFCGAMREIDVTQYLVQLEVRSAELNAAATGARAEAAEAWPEYESAVFAYWQAKSAYADFFIATQKKDNGRAPDLWSLQLGELGSTDSIRPLFEAIEQEKVIINPKPRPYTFETALGNARRILRALAVQHGGLTENPLDLIEDVATDPWMRGPNIVGVPLDLARLLARAAYLLALRDVAMESQVQIHSVLETYDCLEYLSQSAMLLFDVPESEATTDAVLWWNFTHAVNTLEDVGAGLDLLALVPFPDAQADFLREIADTYAEAAFTVRVTTHFPEAIAAALAVIDGVPGTEVGAAAYADSILPEAFALFDAINPNVASISMQLLDGAAAMENLASRTSGVVFGSQAQESNTIMAEFSADFDNGYELLQQGSYYIGPDRLPLFEVISEWPTSFHHPIRQAIYQYWDIIHDAASRARAAHLAMQVVLAN